MSSALRVMVVGCGGIVDSWLKPLVSFNGIKIVGLADLDRARALAKIQEYGLSGAEAGCDVAALLEKVRPDIVCDCTVPPAHHTVVTTALQHGCDVLGEKPMAETMEQARAMAVVAQKSGKVYAVMQNRRYLPDITRLRTLLTGGSIGNLVSLDANFYIGAHFGGFRDEMAHVLLLDMAIHTFDQARFLCGCDPVAVYCHEWNPEGSWYRHGANAVVIFEMTGGVVFTYRGSWCAEGLNTTWEGSWRATATGGSARWEGAEHLEAQRALGTEGFIRSVEEAPLPADTEMLHCGHAGCIREFLDCIRSGGTPQTVYFDNIKSLAMVHAAIASARQKCRVEITG